MITDWHQTLSRVTGAVINGEERITTHELLTHLGVPYSDRAARKLKRIMRRLGWRARKIRLGRETRNGYCRKAVAAVPSLPSGPRADEAPLPGHRADMAAELEAVAQLGLKNLRDILTQSCVRRRSSTRSDNKRAKSTTPRTGMSAGPRRHRSTLPGTARNSAEHRRTRGATAFSRPGGPARETHRQAS